MKIETAAINMNSQIITKIENSESTQTRFWLGERPKFEIPDTVDGGTSPVVPFAAEEMPTASPSVALSADQFDISQQGLEFSYSMPPVKADGVSQPGEVKYEISNEDQIKIKLIEDFLRRLTGNKVDLHVPIKIKVQRVVADETQTIDSTSQAEQSSQVQADGSVGWGLEIDGTQTTSETASFSFSSNGVVKTADGQEISFDLSVQASRQFMESTSFRLRAGDAVVKDPLIISLNGKLPELAIDKISFDLDSDGTTDQISRLIEGNGYLALDYNNDKKVNSGFELFGTKSGSGFADLRLFDEDGNQWIDEKDPVFDKLRIWEQKADGTSTLMALGEKGIGALYLGHMTSVFDIKTNTNDLQGRVQSSGIFLWESGQAGSMHQLDLVL